MHSRSLALLRILSMADDASRVVRSLTASRVVSSSFAPDPYAKLRLGKGRRPRPAWSLMETAARRHELRRDADLIHPGGLHHCWSAATRRVQVDAVPARVLISRFETR